MKKNYFISLLILTVLLTVSCKHKNSFFLEGTIEGGAGKSLYIEEITPEGALFIDSIAIGNNGHYKIRCNIPYPTFYNVCHDSMDYVVIRPSAGDKITLDGSFQTLSLDYKVSGSPETLLLWQLQCYSNDGQEKLSHIVAVNRENKKALHEGTISQTEYDKVRHQLDSLYIDARYEQLEYVSRFIQDNQGCLATLIALYKPFNNSSLIDPRNNFDYYELVLEGLETEFPDNPHTLHFKTTVEHLRHRYSNNAQPHLVTAK